MQAEPTRLPGVLLLTPARHGDGRGFFAETWNRQTLAGLGITTDFVQDNQSLSVQAGTLRGLHCQRPPFAQAKLVRCGHGVLWDVAVDVRAGSPTYGDWFGVELSAANGRQIYIPEGFLHGFVTREPDTEILYKCSAPYAPERETTVRFDDPDLAIDWGLTGAPVLSGKDAAAPGLAGLETGFVWAEGGS